MSRRHKNNFYGNGKIKDALTSLLATVNLVQDPPDFPGEMHAKFDKKTGYNYLGPGTNLEQREIASDNLKLPKNQLDAYAKKHDYQYKDISDNLKANKITKQEAKQAIADADTEFLDNLKNIKGFDMTKILASKAILMKKWLDNNNLIDMNEFSDIQSGTGLVDYHKVGTKMLMKYQDPAYKIRKEMISSQYNEKQKKSRKKQQVGGFAIIPFLLPILGSMAVEGVSKLVSHFMKKDNKQEGTGKRKMKGKGVIQDKIQYIVNHLDDMPPNKQIDLVYNAIK